MDLAPSTMSLKKVVSPEKRYSVVLLGPNASVARECCASQNLPAMITFFVDADFGCSIVLFFRGS